MTNPTPDAGQMVQSDAERAREMVERVARAIAQADGWTDWWDYQDQARAAITAMRDMTMVYRQDGQVVHEMRGTPDDIWKTLLDAALTASAEGEG